MKMLKDSECEGRADEPDGEHRQQGATRPRALGGVTGLHSEMSEEFIIDLLAGSLLLLSFRYNKQVFISIIDTLNISTMHLLVKSMVVFIGKVKMDLILFTSVNNECDLCLIRYTQPTRLLIQFP